MIVNATLSVDTVSNEYSLDVEANGQRIVHSCGSFHSISNDVDVQRLFPLIAGMIGRSVDNVPGKKG